MKRVALGILIMCLGAVSLWAEADPTFIYRGSRLKHRVSLTFDDGPKSELSGELLDVLKKYDVKATFLVVGKECLFNPDMLKRISVEGHDIANHSYSHLRLDTLTEQQIELELSSTNDIVLTLTGKKMVYFRPPGGRYNAMVAQIAARNNLAMLMWDVNTGDYSVFSPKSSIKSPQEVEEKTQVLFDRVMKHVRNGSIILMHNGSIETLNVLPRVIVALKEAGYEIVPVSELLQ